MRTLTPILALAALTTILAACASSDGPGIATREMAQLRADCEARGGVLLPNNAVTGRPALDNFCEIRSGRAAPRG